MTQAAAITNVRMLLQQKLEHLSALYELSEAQAGLIEEVDTDGLLTNISQRQQHLDALVSIEDAMPDRTRMVLDRACSQLAVEINATVERTRKVDGRNQQKLRDYMTFVKAQMRRVSEGRRAGAGYDPGAVGVAAAYFDLKK